MYAVLKIGRSIEGAPDVKSLEFSNEIGGEVFCSIGCYDELSLRDFAEIYKADSSESSIYLWIEVKE